MNSMLLRFILVIFPFLFAYRAAAQDLFVQKDRNTCKYGLKNEENQWIVPPVYASIDPTCPGDDYFSSWCGWIVSPDGKKYGLLDGSGQIVFKPFYTGVRVQNRPPKKNIFEDPFEPFIGSDSMIVLPERLQISSRNHYYEYGFGYPKGLADSVGNILTPMKYGWFTIFRGGYIVATFYSGEAGFAAILDRKGKEIVPAVITDISPPTNHGIYYSIDSASYFFSWKTGKSTEIPMHYAEYGRYEGYSFYAADGDTIFPGRNGHLYGLLSKDGKVIVPAKYNLISPFWPNKIAMVTKQGKYGLINKSGKEILPPDCDTIYPFTAHSTGNGKRSVKKHVVLFRQNGKWGAFADSSGIAIKATYDHAGWLRGREREDIAWFILGKKVFFYRAKEQKMIRLDPKLLFADGDSLLELSGEWQTWYCDVNGKITNGPYPWMRINHEYQFLPYGFVHIESRSGYGIIQTENRIIPVVIVPPVYERAGAFGSFVNSNYMEESTDDGYFYVETFSGRLGIYRQNGGLIVDTAYGILYGYNQAIGAWLAQTAPDQQWKIIDSSGAVIDSSISFPLVDENRSLIIVHHEFYSVVLDRMNDRKLLEGKYIDIQFTGNGYFIVHDPLSGWGIIDSDGKIVLPATYHRIDGPFSEYFRVYNNDGAGICYIDGTIVIAPTSKPFWQLGIRLDSLFDPGSLPLPVDTEREIFLADSSDVYPNARAANNYLLDSLTSIDYMESLHSEQDPMQDMPYIAAGDDTYFNDHQWYEGTMITVTATPVSFTIASLHTVSGHGSTEETFAVQNYFVEKDSMRRIGLYDFIRTDKNYSTLNDTISTRITGYDPEIYFFMNCTWRDSLHPDYFIITNEGLRLIYVDNTDPESAYLLMEEKSRSITIPWAEMKPYIRKKSPVKKLVKKPK
jgi:hypothetical protein